MSLREQLLKNGLVSKEAVTRLEDAKAKKENGLCDLRTVGEFVDLARKILLDDPGQINTVLESAHRFKGSGNEQEKRLYWICYKVRDRLPKLNREKQEILIKRAFRRRNPTPTLPGDRD